MYLGYSVKFWKSRDFWGNGPVLVSGSPGLGRLKPLSRAALRR
jgi:hypothetical protein